MRSPDRHPGLVPGPRFFLPLLAVAITALTGALPAQAQTPASVDYTDTANWLCLPGGKDICAVPLATTDLPASGYAARTTAAPVPAPAAAPPVDCFYVYPTVSHDPGLNSDLDVSDSEERLAAQNQLARFASVCRPFAPVYRQITVGAIAAVMTGGDVAAAAKIAYGDVSAAWHQYLAARNVGRPFVLIGHSQGSLLLQQLIANEIEGRPEAKRMLLAIIPGYNVLVPQGKLVGGSFKSTPLCSRPAQSGCVLAWSSFREHNVPPEGALFGNASVPGMTVGCTNPASPGATGWTKLDSYWTRSGWPSVPGGPIDWSSQGPPPTPFLHTGDLVSGRCINDGPRGYFSIRTNVVPGSKRTDRIGGEVGLMGFYLPGWGMHLNDIAEAQGDLIKRIAEVSRAGLPR